MINQEQLRHNIATIQQQMAKHADNLQKVHLIAVTKGRTVDEMKLLLDEGLNQFGENRPKELLEKIALLEDDAARIEWHYIGRLQRRPVKDIVDKIDYLHSLDRASLAKEINRRATRPVKCFVQVNISQEAQKAGVQLQEVDAFIQSLATYENIHVVGLMTMAPYDAEVEELRHIFKQLQEKQQEIASQNYSHAPCTELSMGMSQDYAIALQEGATFVRIGSAFFE